MPFEKIYTPGLNALYMIRGSKKRLIIPIIISLLMFGVGNLQSYLFFVAFGMKPPIADFILAGSLLGLLAMIPSSVPAKIGQYETVGILTLPHLLNLPRESVFAMLLLIRIISIITILVLGFLATYLLRFDLKIVGAFSGAKKGFLGKVLKLK